MLRRFNELISEASLLHCKIWPLVLRGRMLRRFNELISEASLLHCKIWPMVCGRRLTKRSWFGNLMTSERDETHVILVKDRILSSVKADLIHAFLSVCRSFLPHQTIATAHVLDSSILTYGEQTRGVPQIADLTHSVVSPMAFRVEYKRPGGTAMFQRNVRFHVDITRVSSDHLNPGGDYRSAASTAAVYCISFTLISGPIRRFKRICEHIQAQILGRRPTLSPRIRRRHTPELSDSSSCGSESLSPTERAGLAGDDISVRSAGSETPLARCKSDQTAAGEEASHRAAAAQENQPRALANGRRLSYDARDQL
ncbi:BRSK1 [Cordylochernes scorpioides]|uniref:BRSK1 n=1 Tax=Cordylochernes scorpioides TaxID=51811 RepID=A0ABY6LF51_9ARAC|nr:BRSK1 [Cordylochernes scorpioides]